MFSKFKILQVGAQEVDGSFGSAGCSCWDLNLIAGTLIRYLTTTRDSTPGDQTPVLRGGHMHVLLCKHITEKKVLRKELQCIPKPFHKVFVVYFRLKDLCYIVY